MKHSVITFILFLTLIGCFNIRTGDQGSITGDQSPDIMTQQGRIFEQPIELNAIKNYKNIEFTSGIETKNCEVEAEGFFGSYGLVDMEAQKPFANLVVFVTDQPEKWRSDSGNEQFVSLEIFSKKLVIWDSLQVGLTKNQLKKYIGAQFHYEKGQTLYADFEKYEGIFQFRSDTIMNFEVRTKCDSIK